MVYCANCLSPRPSPLAPRTSHLALRTLPLAPRPFVLFNTRQIIGIICIKRGPSRGCMCSPNIGSSSSNNQLSVLFELKGVRFLTICGGGGGGQKNTNNTDSIELPLVSLVVLNSLLINLLCFQPQFSLPILGSSLSLSQSTEKV